MVAEGGGGGDGGAVGFIFVQFGGAGDGVILAEGVEDFGVEVLEPHTDGAVAVFEAGRDEAVFHLGHFGAGGDHQAVGGAGGKYRVPSAAEALAYRAGAENVGGAAGGDDDHGGAE